MGFFWIFCIVVSSFLTVLLAARFKLQGTPKMVFLNLLLPFAGVLYVLYVVHVVYPRVMKEKLGHDVPSPLQPYLEAYGIFLKGVWQEICKKIKNGDNQNHHID